MKKILVITIAVVLCLTVIGLAFAVVKSEPEDKVISITAGNSAKLTIGGLTDGTINPTTPVVRNIRLYNTQSSNLEGTGTLTIVATGDLAQALTLSWQVGATTPVAKAALATGVSYELTSMPIDGTLTISFDSANYDYEDYAELTATITISFEYDEFAPVDGAYYLIGDFNGWDLNKYAILLDETHAGDNAFKSNVPLAAGSYKAVQYHSASGDFSWTGGNNMVVDGNAAGYDIYVNGSNETWIEAHQ